jgi:hypothetical protein
VHPEIKPQLYMSMLGRSRYSFSFYYKIGPYHSFWTIVRVPLLFRLTLVAGGIHQALNDKLLKMHICEST